MKDPPPQTARIARGQCAYYDSEFYLRYLRVADDSGSGIGSTLHIMKDCVVYMPVVLAMEKNSALKRRVDSSIQRLAEGGKKSCPDIPKKSSIKCLTWQVL